jgi:hypothetical protein
VFCYGLRVLLRAASRVARQIIGVTTECYGLRVLLRAACFATGCRLCSIGCNANVAALGSVGRRLKHAAPFNPKLLRGLGRDLILHWDDEHRDLGFDPYVLLFENL